MSKQVDERVVSMQFDNKNFESNVATTMLTLDKFKEKLNFTGATKGLENINSAANNVNMDNLGSAIETVRERFSALEVMGVTALANITNSAVNTGKRMISALTVDPIKTGFSEYETQINSVQTILANTSSKGTTIDDVTAALDELNKYADLTIYNFTEMTRNIGTFTAAGIDLDTSVNAIQGIANLAAVSGSTSQQASTAMYQLSQALAAGTVKLMDWNSVVNAGMGGEVFQNALKETSRLLGTGADAAIEAQGSFRESLKTGWLTSEVLTETLKKFTTSGANEYVAAYTGLSVEAVEAALESAEAQYGEAEAIEYAAKALADKSGASEDEIKSALQMAKTAEDAATKVKTFTQLWDVMKEAAQSGWAKTWQILIGDFEEAKDLLTPLADFFTNIIGKISDARNNLLEGAMGSPFGKLSEKISAIAKPIESVSESIETVTDAVKDYESIVNRIIGGEFGDGQARWDKLTEMGYNWAHAQNLVNEKLGVSIRHTTDYTEAQKEANKTQATTVEQLTDMSDAQLESIGFTEDEIDALRELEYQSEKTGIPIKDLIEDMDQLSGRSLLINSFKNVGKSLVTIFKAIGEAYRNAFPAMKSSQLYDIISAIHKFSTKLVISEKTADNLTRTFKGLFAIIDIIATITGGALRLAFKAVTQLLGMFNLDILDVTAVIGDVIVKVRDWFESILDFTAIFEIFIPYIMLAADIIRIWINELKESDAIKKFTSYLKNSADSIREWVESLKDSKNLPRDVIAGLVNGLRSGVTAVWNAALAIGKAVLESICNFLGIHSPSTEFIEVGKNIIDGLVQGLQNGFSKVWNTVTNIGSKIVEFFKNLDFGTLFAGGLATALTISAVKIANTISKFAAPMDGLGEMFEDIGDGAKKMFKGIASNFKAKAWEHRSEALLNFAKAIAILAASVYVLAKLDKGQLWNAVGALGALAGIIALLAGVLVGLDSLMNKFGSKNALEMGKFALALIALSGSLLIMTFALKNIAGMSGGEIGKAAATLIGLTVLISALAYITDFTGHNMDEVGKMILKLSVSLLLLVIVIKAISLLKPEDLTIGLITIGILGTFFVALIAATKLFDSGASSVGSVLLKMAASMLLMVIVIKAISMLEPEALIQGLSVIWLLSGIFMVLIAATNLFDKNGSNVGSTLLAMSAAMLIMTMVVKILGDMDAVSLVKGTVAVAALAAIMIGLVAATNLVGTKDLTKVGSTLLMMSLAIGILAVVATLLGFIDVEHLVKGITAITILGTIMALMIWATKGANDCKGNIIAMTVAIAIMAAAVAALSFIDTKKLATSTAALTALMLSFAAIAKASGSSGSWKSMASLIVMTAVVGILAFIIYKLAELDVGPALSATASIALLMVAMSAAMRIASKSASSWTKALIGIGLLTLMVVPLTAFCLALHYLPDVTGAVGNVILLTTLMTAMTLLLAVLTIIGIGGWAGLIGVGLLTAMVVPLTAFCLALHYLPDVTGAVGNVILLTTLMTAMTLLLVPLTLIGFLAIGALAGVIALTAMVIPLVAFGIALALLPDVSSAVGNVQLLTILMTSMTQLLEPLIKIGFLALPALAGIVALTAMVVPLSVFALALAILPDITGAANNIMLLTSLMHHLTNMLSILAPIAPLALLGVAAISGLTLLIAGIGVMAAAVGKLMDICPSLQGFLDTGIPVLIQLSGAIGTMIGEFVSSMLTSISSSLPQIGTDLGMFMTNAMPFIIGAKMIDASMVENVKGLAGAIIALTAADLIAGMLSFSSNGSSFAQLGADLSMFMMNAMPFIMGAKMLTSDMATGVKALAETVVILTAADILDGLTSWLTGGGTSLADFGKQIAEFGPYMAEYAAAVKGIDGEAVTASANAAKALTEMATSLPKEGGLLSKITGENDLATFGATLVPFGTSLKEYSIAVTGLDSEAINTSVKAAKKVIEIADIIPNTGGLIAAVTGDNDIAEFGAKLVPFGTSLKEYSIAVTGLDMEAINVSVKATKKLIKIAESVPESGGLIAKITGDNDLEQFGAKLASYGTNLSTYSTNVSGMTSENVDASITATEKLIALVKDMVGLDTSGVEIFRTAVDELAKTNISDLVETFGEMTTDMSNIGTNLVNSIANGITTGTTGLLTDAAISVINSASNTLKSGSSSFNDAGSKLITAFVAGMNGSKDTITNSVSSITRDSVASATSYYSQFYAAGSYLVSGFCSGISTNTWMAEAKAETMAEAAAKAARKALDINSPSKVFREIGYSIPEGFAMGIDRLSSVVTDSSVNMSEVAVDNVNDSIARIVDIINSDIDSQPTIRPVLDLTDVRSGISSIGNMLSGKTTLQVGAQTAGIVATSMSNRQNRNSDDVVSAIKGLRDDITNTPRNTYNVNGITYDDGTNVANAVGALVRAARIEGRA